MTYPEFFGRPRFALCHLQVTNVCNLHCEHCGAGCEEPIRPESPRKLRRKARQMPLEILESFCERFKGIGEQDRHNFTGGEPTVVRPELLQQYMDVLHRYHRRMTIRTNGYGLRRLPEEYVKRFSEIWLDNHGTNARVIRETDTWLGTFYGGEIKHCTITGHINIRKAMQMDAGRTIWCKQWLKYLALTPEGVIHPCCGTTVIQAMLDDDRMDRELAKAGWSLENPNVVQTLLKWRKTVPSYVLHQCFTNCYYPVLFKAQTTPITSKSEDVLQCPMGKMVDD